VCADASSFKTLAAGDNEPMVTLGLILLLIGLIFGPSLLTTIGLILLVVGLILNVVPMGGERRRVW
jgi:hypothetical protein